MRKAVWIAYDFGLRGDYQGLYTWLDTNKALECGQGLAFLKFATTKDVSSSDLMAEVMKDFKRSVKVSKTDRIYIVCKDSISNKIKGDFLNGARKAAPWEGYGNLSGQQIVDEGE
ncbi:hypothetical protein INP83_03130 [Mucilaginibacter sp. 21P]|nr:hypothetical protein INP83_03130 [Mucilaginibacter sp. 21P]